MNKKSRSHRSAADGVVAHTQMFQNALRNVTRERPPRPRLFGTGPFLDGAATPPHEEGNIPTFYLGDDTGMPFPAIRDSSRATVSGNGSGAGPRTPARPAPRARSRAVLPSASFARRSAPFSARNFTKAVKPLSAAPCNAVWCGTANGLGT